MFENIERDEERGQVGIGTLIVFIALVLVAAIAAGVLINTAGFLQNQAESTGQESTNQVSNNVDILSTTGSVTGAGGEVETITITVGLAPGSDPVNLSATRFELLSNQSYTATGADIGGSADSTLTEGEQVTIEAIDLDTSPFSASNLAEGEEAELRLVTPDGSQTVDVLNVPDPIANGDSVRL